jgi:hypothetical protein
MTGMEQINPLKTEFLLNNNYKNSVRTSQETYYVFAIKQNPNIHSVGRTQSFRMSTQVVHVKQLGFKGLNI